MVKVISEQEMENFFEVFEMFKQVADKKARYLTKSEVIELFAIYRRRI